MRRLLVLAVLASSVFLLAAGGIAPTAGQITVGAPANALVAPVRISDFRVVGATPWDTGKLALAIDVKNAGDKPSGSVRVMFWYLVEEVGTKMLEEQVDVPPGGKVTVRFDDPGGLRGTCGATGYNVQLSGSANVDAKNHVGWVLPSCTYKTSSVKDSFNVMRPDTVEAMTANAAFLKAPALGAAYACGKDMLFGVDVRNDAVKNATAFEVRMLDVNGKPMAKDVIDVKSKSTGHAVVHSFASGRAGNVKVQLFDPTNSLAGKVASQQLSVDVTRSCTSFTTKLDGSMPMPNP
jgi:hypothetical protein